jgi:outer membrane usher protein
MRRRALAAAELVLAALLGFVFPAGLLAQDATPSKTTDSQQAEIEATTLQLEVFVNGTSSQFIATFSRGRNGEFSIDAAQLRNVGVLPQAKARQADGQIAIARLSGVSYRYDETGQAMYFTARQAAMAPHVIDAQAAAPTVPAAKSGIGGLINYSLYSSTGGGTWEELGDFRGLSGSFEARIFSPLGVLTSSQILTVPSDQVYGSTRLDTQWSYQDDRNLMSYRLGDVITGGLAWTRPTRLGGIQVQRNFGLRPDMVTMPVPTLSGSAAVPSTVDVYVNNARRISSAVPAGPFQITNLPVVTGEGTARLVVTDPLGRATVSETPFYASSNLLAPELIDVSAEIGFARSSYGIRSDDYDSRVLGSTTARYGLSNALTMEGHIEAGASLLNAGIGGVFNMSDYGIGSVAGSASSYGGNVGMQLAASVETEIWGMHVFARSQHSFGDYNDIASVIDQSGRSRSGYSNLSSRPPRSLDQISLSVPLKFDPSSLNLSYTQLQYADGDGSRILGLTANRPVGQRGNVFVTGYRDLEQKRSFGLFVGLSYSFDNRISGSTGIASDSAGTSVTTDVVKSETPEVGSVGWRLRGSQGGNTLRDASASYRAPFARLEAGVSQYGGATQASAQIDGAAVFAGGDVFFTDRIDDAFVVVDAGAPGVDVQLENRQIGKTGRTGTLILPGLKAYDSNRVSIDPSNLPLDARIDSTNEVVVPQDRSGSVVKFGVDAQSRSVLLTLNGDDGLPVETGATGSIEDGKSTFVIGYDGQAYVETTGKRRHMIIDQPTRGRCEADLPAQASVSGIPGATVVCRAVR